MYGVKMFQHTCHPANEDHFDTAGNFADPLIHPRKAAQFSAYEMCITKELIGFAFVDN